MPFSFTHFLLKKNVFVCDDFPMHKYCHFLEDEILSWPASRLENSLKRCFTVLRYMCTVEIAQASTFVAQPARR